MRRISVVMIGLLWSVSLFAESYNENNLRWIINPTNPTWSCPMGTLLPGESCYPVAPNRFNYVGALPLYVQKLVNGVLTPKLYLYVEEWGSGSGPGSGCAGDSYMLFELPWSYSGLRGDAGVTYRGTINRCDGFHHAISSVFKDQFLGSKIFILGTRAPNGSTFPEIELGQSEPGGGQDNGVTFSWSSLLTTTNPNLSLTGAQVLPDPARPGIWWGLLSYDVPDDQYFLPSTWIEVNWNTNQIRVLTSATGWTSVPIGGVLNTPPYPVLPYGGRLIQTRGRYEIWSTILAERSGVTPCAGGALTSIYLGNTSTAVYGNGNYARGFAGSDVVYAVATPSFTLGPVNHLTSSVRPIPSDTGDFGYPARIDFGGYTNALYTGTLDATICTHDLVDWNPWSGSGIVFTNLTLVP